MALIQISEPGQMPEPHERRQAVGIDLGTTNSLVAAMRSGGPRVLSDEQGKTLVPSIVNYGENGIVCTGDSARRRSVSDPLNTLISWPQGCPRGPWLCPWCPWPWLWSLAGAISWDQGCPSWSLALSSLALSIRSGIFSILALSTAFTVSWSLHGI